MCVNVRHYSTCRANSFSFRSDRHRLLPLPASSTVTSSGPCPTPLTGRVPRLFTAFPTRSYYNAWYEDLSTLSAEDLKSANPTPSLLQKQAHTDTHAHTA